ncbi:DUF1826 domain-containing protein [Sphingomonas silueang]|uniref:DUF1826 domain-containing protein n=1 Tax=Sphingomonas silueang TaxID=3156617 RepID=UPI0032B3D67E
MSVVATTCDVATGRGADALDGIGHPRVALAIWERSLPPVLHDALALLDLARIDDVVTGIAAADAPDELLRDAGYPDVVADGLAADIAVLARRHARLTGADRLTLKLEVVETDACRRFHADYVTLRMLCTYVGPGTQWHAIADPDTIGQVPTGAVAIFKGRMLLDPPTVLHRSPPIVATGERRLMLTLDPA